MPNESSVLVRLRLLGGAAFARQAGGAARGLSKVDPAARNVSARLRGVNRFADGAALALKGVAAAGAAAVATGLLKGVAASANFEQSMANVQARLLTTKPVMERLQQQALQLGAKTSFSAQQAADAMGEFAAAGFNASQIMRIMPGTLNLAAASGTDLAFAAETSGAMIRPFGLHASDAGHVADVLTLAVNKSAIGLDDMAETMKYVGPIAGRFNQSLEDMSASAAILGNVGIKGEQAGTTLRAGLVKIIRPTQRTVGVLRDLGITQGEFAKATTDAHGKLRPMPQILGNLAKQFSGLTGPDKRRALAQLFGTEALPGMVTLMGMGQKRIEKMSGALSHSGGAAKRTAGIMRGTVKGAWEQFTGAIETAQISLLRGFNPALQTVLRTAARGVGKGTAFISEFASGKNAAGAGLRAGLAGRKGPETEGFKGIGKVMVTVGDTIRRMGPAIAKTGAQLVDAFKPALPFFQNVLLPLLKGIAIGVIGSVVAAFKVLIPVIRVVATAVGFLGRLLAPLKPVFQGIGVVIGFLVAGPILKLLGGLRYLGVAFRILAVPVRIANGVFRVIGRVIGRLFGVFERVQLGVLRFVSTFASVPARAARTALNLVSSIINVVKALPGKLLGFAKSAGSKFTGGIVGKVRSALPGITSFFGRVGKAILDAVVNAIKSAPGAIAGAISSIVPGPVKGAVKKIIPGIATGGVVRRGGVAMVGERGPELARFPTGTRVYNADDTRRMVRGAGAMSSRPVFLQANLFLSGKQIHSEVFRVERQLVEAT